MDSMPTYIYPDEDLCLFEHFPHEQLVIPSVALIDDEEICSCTLIWLMKNYKIYSSRTSLKLRKDFRNYFNSSKAFRCMRNYSLLFHSCQFEKKFNNCLIIETNFRPRLTALNFFYLFEWLKLVLEVYFKTCLALLGVITNLLIMMVIKNKKQKVHLDNFMYKHIFFNSMFNFLFCLIHSFSLMNVCIFPKSSFCSTIYKTIWAQYFKIIFIEFLGNSLRLCCNFSFILFSVSRFYKSLAIKSNWFLKFEKLNLKLFYFLMFVSCCLWSMFKLFEYRPNEIYSSYDKNFPYNRYDLKYCQSQYIDSLYSFLSSGCKIFPILNLINNVLNNILFLFISLVIDIGLIRFANQNYQHKKELFHDPKHLEEALAHKNKIRKLIITNGILYFFSHMPEFTSTILLIVFKKRLQYFCFNFFPCTQINELFETFAFMSMVLQFFVHKHFDQNFIESFNNLKSRFFKFFKIKRK